MIKRHRQYAYRAGFVLVIVWLLTWWGYSRTQNTVITAEKVRIFLDQTDLKKLEGDARRLALAELAKRVNAMSAEERRKCRFMRQWQPWYESMTETEKAAFVEATMPAGIEHMLAAFEKLPPQQRRVVVDESIRRWQDAWGEFAVKGKQPRLFGAEDQDLPVVTEEMERQIVTLGLQAYYQQSSAQAKAELGPWLEEIQRIMQSGWLFKRPQAPRR